MISVEENTANLKLKKDRKTQDLENLEKLRKMKKGMVFKFFINTTKQIMPYIEISDIDPLVVYELDGKCGIMNYNGTDFLKCEFDNISIFGFKLLLLNKSGKLGLLHIEEEKDKLISYNKVECIYDYAKTKDMETSVALYRFFDNKKLVSVYLPKCRKLFTDGCNFVHIDREIFSFTGDHEGIYRTITGEEVLDIGTKAITASYNTSNGGTVIVLGDIAHNCLIYSRGDEQNVYLFEGKDWFSKVEAVPCLTEDGLFYAQGFIVYTKEGIVLLDEECIPKHKDSFDAVFFNSAFACYKNTKDSGSTIKYDTWLAQQDRLILERRQKKEVECEGELCH